MKSHPWRTYMPATEQRAMLADRTREAEIRRDRVNACIERRKASRRRVVR